MVNIYYFNDTIPEAINVKMYRKIKSVLPSLFSLSLFLFLSLPPASSTSGLFSVATKRSRRRRKIYIVVLVHVCIYCRFIGVCVCINPILNHLPYSSFLLLFFFRTCERISGNFLKKPQLPSAAVKH